MMNDSDAASDWAVLSVPGLDECEALAAHQPSTACSGCAAAHDCSGCEAGEECPCSGCTEGGDGGSCNSCIEGGGEEPCACGNSCDTRTRPNEDAQSCPGYGFEMRQAPTSDGEESPALSDSLPVHLGASWLDGGTDYGGLQGSVIGLASAYASGFASPPQGWPEHRPWTGIIRANKPGYWWYVIPGAFIQIHNSEHNGSYLKTTSNPGEGQPQNTVTGCTPDCHACEFIFGFDLDIEPWPPLNSEEPSDKDKLDDFSDSWHGEGFSDTGKNSNDINWSYSTSSTNEGDGEGGGSGDAPETGWFGKDPNTDPEEFPHAVGPHPPEGRKVPTSQTTFYINETVPCGDSKFFRVRAAVPDNPDKAVDVTIELFCDECVSCSCFSDACLGDGSTFV